MCYILVLRTTKSIQHAEPQPNQHDFACISLCSSRPSGPFLLVDRFRSGQIDVPTTRVSREMLAYHPV